MTPQCSCRRTGRLTSWILPSATLALLPKCPMCVAAYVAMLTGIGISIPLAAHLRMGLIVLSVLALASLAARRARIHFKAK